MCCFGKLFSCNKNRYPKLKKQYLAKAKHWLENENLDEDGDLYCPLTLELFQEPVITPSGHVFERHIIEQWLEIHPTNPIVTSEKLTPSMLEPFPELVELVASFNSNKGISYI